MKHSVHSKVVGMVAFKSLAIEKSINQRLPSFFASPACNEWQERESERECGRSSLCNFIICMCIYVYKYVHMYMYKLYTIKFT